MTPDGFLSLVALILAALAFLPPERRLQLRATLRLGVFITIPALVGVLYFEFFKVAQRPCSDLIARLCPRLMMTEESSLAPHDAAFAITIGWSAIMWLIYSRKTIGGGALPVMKSILVELERNHEYTTLANLVEPHLALVKNAAERNLRRQRLYDYFARLRGADLEITVHGLLDDGEPVAKPLGHTKITRSLKHACGLPGLLLPAALSAEEAATSICQHLLTSEGVRKYAAARRPAFGIALMQLPGYLSADFTGKFLKDLMADTSSPLYREVERSGGANGFTQLAFDEHSPILGALLNDANVAARAGVYRPIAEHLLARLQGANDPAYVNSLNLKPDALWSEHGRYKDTAFTTVLFFDLMVTAAVQQDVHDHMWLMYCDYFVEAILVNYSENGPDVDPEAEWPTRSSEILCRVIEALRHWILSYQNLPEGGWHRRIERKNLLEGEGRIPKSALICLCDVVQQIQMSPNVGVDFRHSIMSMVLGIFRELPRVGDDRVYRNLLIKGLAGERLGGARLRRYRAMAHEAFLCADPPLQEMVPELGMALKPIEDIVPV